MKQLKLIQPIRLSRLILLFFFCCLSPIPYTLSYAANLTVEDGGKLKTDTLTFNKNSSIAVGSASSDPAGKVIYSQASEVAFSDGVNWQPVGHARTVATRIVAANNSLGTAGNPLKNKRADYTCNGSDDQNVINNAISNISAIGMGGVVYLLEGNYNLTNSINISSNISLIGTGAGTILSSMMGSGQESLIMAQSASNVSISQLRIYGANSTMNDYTGVYFNATNYSYVDSIWVQRLDQQPIRFQHSNFNRVFNSHIYNSSKMLSGISLINSSFNGIFGNNFYANGINASMWTSTAAVIALTDNSSGNLISHNILEANEGYNGIILNTSCNNNTISGNVMQRNGGYCVYIYGGSTATGCTNNMIAGNILDESRNITARNFTGIGLVYSNNNTIRANHIGYHLQGGLVLNASSQNSILGNGFLDNGFNNNTTSGNHSIALWADGANGSSNNLLSYNFIGAGNDSISGEYGIYIADPASADNHLSSNYIVGAGYFNISGWPLAINETIVYDNGTNTTYSGKEKITLAPSAIDIDSLISNTSPISYVRVNKSGNWDVDAGKSTGDILIVEGAGDTNTFNDGGNLALNNTRILGDGDTLKLIWNGKKWVEVAYSDN